MKIRILFVRGFFSKPFDGQGTRLGFFATKTSKLTLNQIHKEFCMEFARLSELRGCLEREEVVLSFYSQSAENEKRLVKGTNDKIKRIVERPVKCTQKEIKI